MEKFTPIDGLYKIDDNTPASGALTVNDTIGDALIDEDFCATAWYLAEVHTWSFGVDLGSAKQVEKMVLYDWSVITDGLWVGKDEIDIYRSDDNVNWTFVESWDPATRAEDTKCPGKDFSITCTLSTPATARYWKMWAAGGGLASDVGTWLYISEVEAWGGGKCLN